MIAATMFLMRYAVIFPMLAINNLSLQLKMIDFILLVFSTVLIAAAGYIINDYFDIRIDSINKPSINPIGKSIKRQTAMALHLILNGIAYIMAFVLCYRVGNIKWSVIFLISIGLLWFYSTTFKKQLIIGNLIVSILTALIPLLVGLFELPLLNVRYQKLMQEFNFNFNTIAYFIFAFSGFAFLSNFWREIIKDAEDEMGDRTFGAETIPVVWGLKVTNKIIFIMGLLQSSLIAYLQYLQWIYNDKVSFFYMLFLLQLPLVYISFSALKAKSKETYHKLSLWSKGYMFLGLMYSLVIYWLLIGK
jgi:4-hydroxybenzoate polyprenyltransferase